MSTQGAPETMDPGHEIHGYTVAGLSLASLVVPPLLRTDARAGRRDQAMPLGLSLVGRF